MSIKNSPDRYELFYGSLSKNELFSPEDLKKLLATKYLEGPCCHYYDEFIGTLRSMIMDIY
ncbi:hypothetical protein J9303_13095 [Bacillaceae bacterium Marseille-Q3522]|nr:hypothetical protein [Bacillaceae bacterium Marseille-Q3522]